MATPAAHSDRYFVPQPSAWPFVLTAGLVSLVAFVSLIFVPAIGSYGRIWEKAAAGFLSLIVLVALVLTGVVVGLAVVYYYNDIVEILG